MNTIANNAPVCNVTKAAKLVGDTWTLLIVKELIIGEKRFCQLQNTLTTPGKSSTVSSKTLTQRLKLLENEGVVSRKVTVGSPIKVEYSLTQKGEALSKVIKDLYDFGLHYM